tara:strand:+ start:252 stop:725 length:474 start_codon:yes stop_codon:yes gene_type:complete
MRELVENVITDEMANDLLGRWSKSGRIRDCFNQYPVDFLVDIVKQYAPINPGGKSYINVECMPRGHDKHYDGCKLDLTPNHMPWCQYSAVSLLSDPREFEGGMFRFYDPDVAYREELFRNLLIYSSGADNDPQLHSAESHHSGERWMLLMFFEGAEW